MVVQLVVLKVEMKAAHLAGMMADSLADWSVEKWAASWGNPSADQSAERWGDMLVALKVD